MFCENLLSIYKGLKSKSFELKEENKNLFSKLDLVLQERVEISNERDSLKVQLDLCNAPIPRIRGRHCNVYT